MRIDHLTIAGPDLSILQGFFSDAGMTTDYGGPHSNGITHMALLGFDNGSYIEIVSTVTPGARVPLWQGCLLGPGGGTAWTIDSANVLADAHAAEAAGIDVAGPIRVKRHKPDGTTGEWDLAYLGKQQPGGLLPFLIHDITPRIFRSKPSQSVAGKLWGFSHMVLAVGNLASAASELGKIFHLPGPSIFQAEHLGQLMCFSGLPIVLAEAPEHLREFGESPCAAVIAAYNLETFCGEYELSRATPFMDRSVSWLDTGMPCRIGIGAGPGNH